MKSYLTVTILFASWLFLLHFLFRLFVRQTFRRFCRHFVITVPRTMSTISGCHRSLCSWITNLLKQVKLIKQKRDLWVKFLLTLKRFLFMSTTDLNYIDSASAFCAPMIGRQNWQLTISSLDWQEAWKLTLFII